MVFFLLSVFQSGGVSLYQRTARRIAASLLVLLCQVNVPFFQCGDGREGVGCIVDSEMMIALLTLCCCLPKTETNRRNKEISLHLFLHLLTSGQKWSPQRLLWILSGSRTTYKKAHCLCFPFYNITVFLTHQNKLHWLRTSASLFQQCISAHGPITACMTISIETRCKNETTGSSSSSLAL